MKWENPSPETYANFVMLIHLLRHLNELDDSSLSRERFTWKFADTKMYIDGIPDALANLLCLLWCHSEHYSFYMFQENGNSMIEVIYH